MSQTAADSTTTLSSSSSSSSPIPKPRLLTVGVVGVGVVGGSVYSFLKAKENKLVGSVVGYDKFREGFNTEDHFEALLDQDMLFLCLPTLYNDDIRQYDKSAIHEVCGKLNEQRYTGLVVVKSTVEPGTTETLSRLYGELDFAHNPEFLTARTAHQDFAEQSHVVLGKSERCNERKFKKLEQLMRLFWPNAEYSFGTSTETESMKSFCNCFYAQKISIFNEYYTLCKEKGIDYQRVLGMMLKNGWINPMHTNVPGPDGKMGYGGMCFPKDTAALYQYMRRENLPHRMIKASVRENKEMRGE